MPPIFDERQALGDVPGLHALIVGVGEYRYLQGGAQAVADPWDMTQLTSTASSANKIYEWLLQANKDRRLPVPLATCRLLLSPSPGEVHLTGVAAAATLDNFIRAANEWRDDCKTDQKNVAFFYFAGHGVQRNPEDAVLCLEEFRQPGSGSLVKSVSLANIVGGMAPAPGFQDIARTQLYFIDACRVRPERFSEFDKMGTTDVFDVSLAGRDDRCAPIFHAAISNAAAAAIPGQQTLFSRAILDCLKGQAGEAIDETVTGDAVWGVTVDSLNAQLDGYKIDELNRECQADQTYAPGGQFRPRTICRLAAPPPVRFRVEMIPPEAAQFSRLTFRRAVGGAVVHDVPPPIAHPHEGELPGGQYNLEISFDPPSPFHPAERSCNLKPVNFVKKVKVD